MRKLIGALVAAFLLLGTAPAQANQYEIFIDIENEEDLYDLLASRQISDDTFNTLLELLQRGVNLNSANRQQLYVLPNLTYRDVDAIISYRNTAGFIKDPAVLALNNVLSRKKFLSIAAFLVVKDRTRPLYATTGQLRAQTVWTTKDDRVPATAMSLRLSTLRNLSIGVLGVITRNRVGSPIYDPSRDALVAEAPSSRIDVPKFYAQWDTDDFRVIVGNYTASFGEGLVWDTSPGPRRTGIYPDDSHRRETDLTRQCRLSTGELTEAPCDSDVYVTPDFKWTDYQMGIAAGLKGLKVGNGRLRAYGLFSFQPLDIYQYRVYDKNRCDDPRNDNDPGCGAPDVFVLGDDPFAPAAEHSFQTLPNLLREMTVGGNVAYSPQRRVEFGVTGYRMEVKSLTEGLDLDSQEWDAKPFGGPFGAVGAYAAVGRKWLDVFAELAYSFDSMPGKGGGPAAVARIVASRKQEELEATFRYYDENYANPLAGAYAQADTFDGLRDRDEVGGRLKYFRLFKKKINFRASVDVWNRPSLDRYKAEIRMRTDINASKVFGYGLWLEFDDRDLGSGPLVCDNSADEIFDADSSLTPACGQSFNAIGRIRWSPHKKWRLSAQYQHEFIQDEDAMDMPRTRQDVSAWLNAFGRPTPELGVRARVRYLFEDIADNGRLEQSIWAYVNLRYRVQKRHWFNLRYDLRRRIDDRTSTLDRNPRTESWLWAQYLAKF